MHCTGNRHHEDTASVKYRSKELCMWFTSTYPKTFTCVTSEILQFSVQVISNFGRNFCQNPLVQMVCLLAPCHWALVLHICISKLTIIGTENGLPPCRRQAIIWTNAGILLIGPQGTNYSEILIKIHIFTFKKMRLITSSGKWQPFCLSLSVLNKILKVPPDICQMIYIYSIHYDDDTMGAIASQITSLTIVYSTVYSDADQRKHQSSASLAFVWGIHRGLVNSPHKWLVMQKMFPFDDIIMKISEPV